jgi:8-oxo-(d)GTP phosphatase
VYAFSGVITTVIESAGLVVYRENGKHLEVLLVHPSGNYNRRAPWGIPKGLPDGDEPLVQAAVRETRAETRVDLSAALDTGLVPLGYVEYKRSRKRIHAFAAPAPAGAEPNAACWEIDQAEFLPIEEARQRIHPDQLPLLERLVEFLSKSKADHD